MRNLLNTGFLFLIFLVTVNANPSKEMATPPAEELGIASYYSDAFHGRKTASGELYDKNKLTGAHKSLPFGTIIKVTRLDNRKSVKIRINDRGPYIKGRIVELSKKAALQVDLINDGTARIKIEILGKGDLKEEPVAVAPPPAQKPKNQEPKATPKEYVKESVPKPEPKITESVKKATETSKTSAPAPTKVAQKTPAVKNIEKGEVVAPRVKAKDYKDFDLYKIQLMRPERKGFGVQVASLTNYEYVMKQVAELQERWFKNVLLSIEKGKDGKPVYKCILGPFPDKATALSYQKRLKKKKGITGFIVDLSSINY